MLLRTSWVFSLSQYFGRVFECGWLYASVHVGILYVLECVPQHICVLECVCEKGSCLSLLCHCQYHSASVPVHHLLFYSDAYSSARVLSFISLACSHLIVFDNYDQRRAWDDRHIWQIYLYYFFQDSATFLGHALHWSTEWLQDCVINTVVIAQSW